MAHRVYIGLGSNLGDRKANLREAEERLTKLPETRIVKASSLYESEPLDDAKSAARGGRPRAAKRASSVSPPWFVNNVLELETEFEAEELLKRTRAIEAAMGRKRVKGKRWGSRIIDIDILLFDNQTINKRSLKIPHPEMHKRRFVLLPLSELAPHFTHPQLGVTISEILGGLKDPKKVVLMRP